MANNNDIGKFLESWSWDAACSIRGAKDSPKYKDHILPLIFTKRLGVDDFEGDIIGKSYEYLIRKSPRAPARVVQQRGVDIFVRQ